MALAAVGVVGAVYLAKKYCEGAVCQSTAKLDGKTVLITGGNVGIGKETAVDLARRGARVIIGCRDLEKGKNALQEIQGRSGNIHIYLEKLDLASLESVRTFADRILNSEPRLDILINNAGVMACPYTTTTEGFELQFGVNHLGHFLLTHLLLDLLKRSSPSRIINVSSLGHRMVSGINFIDINSTSSYSRWGAYGQSKLANILFTRELARRLQGSGVSVFSLHPGSVQSDLGRHTFTANWLVSTLCYPFMWIYFKSTEQGAQTSIYCAVQEGLESESGKYFAECGLREPSAAGKNDGMAKKLWDVSVRMVGL